jgi:hypothetical protein
MTAAIAATASASTVGWWWLLVGALGYLGLAALLLLLVCSILSGRTVQELCRAVLLGGGRLPRSTAEQLMLDQHAYDLAKRRAQRGGATHTEGIVI